MARTNNLTNFLTDVADAIREKKGTEETIQASDFDTEIANLPSGGSDNTYSFYNDGTMGETINNSGINIVVNGNVPAYAFGTDSNISIPNIREVTMNEGIEKIGQYAFSHCDKMILRNDKLPNSLKTIERNAFYSCHALKIKTIPDNITTLPRNALSYCNSIKQISMNNVNSIYSSSSSSSTFDTTYLIAVWLGSAITSSGLGRYAFPVNTIQKIYINLPRTKIESFSNYSYKFCNNLSTNVEIICNDDEGFITKAEFDAIDWSTQ